MRTPIAVADDCDREAAGGVAVFGGKKHAANLRLDAQHGEEVAGDQLAPYALGMICDSDAEGHGSLHRDTVQKLETVAVVDVIGIGVWNQFPSGSDGLNGDQAAGVCDSAQ